MVQPKCRKKDQIEWGTDVTVEQRRAEPRSRRHIAQHTREHLAKPEQLEMANQEHADQYQALPELEDGIHCCYGESVPHCLYRHKDRLPLPVQQQRREIGKQNKGAAFYRSWDQACPNSLETRALHHTVPDGVSS